MTGGTKETSVMLSVARKSAAAPIHVLSNFSFTFFPIQIHVPQEQEVDRSKRKVAA